MHVRGRLGDDVIGLGNVCLLGVFCFFVFSGSLDDRRGCDAVALGPLLYA